MTKLRPFGIVAWLHMVTASDLTSTDRLVLLVLAEWINWSTLELWPSVTSIAGASGLTARTVGTRLEHLAERGIVEFVQRSRGGRTGGRGVTHRLRVQPAAIAPRNPEGDSGYDAQLNSEGHSGQFRNPRGSSPKAAREFSEPGSEEPSIHPSNEHIKEPSRPASEKRSLSADGCLDPPEERSPRESLIAHRIRGRNLELLAAALGITTAAIEEEHRRILQSRGIRNPAAVLTNALASRFDVALPRPRTLTPDVQAVVSQIERLRRRDLPPLGSRG